MMEWMEKNTDYKVEIVRRPDGAKGFVLLMHRWMSERTFAWLGRCRRLSKDYEHLTETSEAMVKISMIHLMLRRLEPSNNNAEFHYAGKNTKHAA